MTDATAQIARLDINPDRPLVICDVDEVVVHFLRALDSHLAQNDLWLDATSFALNGNIRTISGNEPIENSDVYDLLHSFFASATGSMTAIEGAVDTLTRIEEHADLVFLTNLPHAYAAARQRNLNDHGLNAPIVTNAGPKGPAVKQLMAQVTGKAVFIDDAPNHIVSVRDATPHVDLIHFINDDRMAKLLPDLDGVALRTGKWREASDFLQDWLGD